MKLIYCRHDPDSMRIWRDDWFGDQFEIIPNDDLEVIERVMPFFGIQVELQDED